MIKAVNIIKNGLQRLRQAALVRRWSIYEILLRLAADGVLVNIALISALTLRFLWFIVAEGGGPSAREALNSFGGAYLQSFSLVTGLCWIVFSASGFYTHGRSYRSRYKVLIVARAVSISYLLFTCVLYLLRDEMIFPRSALFLSWLLTAALLIATRLWSTVWPNLAAIEERFSLTAPRGKVRDVLVIGGAGYIGSALVERLLQLGYRVAVLDMLLYGDDSISKFYGHPNFELIPGDLRRIDTVVHAARGRDAIVHLGAIVGDSACSICEDLTIEINLEATRTIAEIGKGFGVNRFIFASTCSVYGASDETLDERSALNPLSLYARTKMDSEKVLLRLADHAFAPTIMRFGTIYGLSGRPRFDLVVNVLAAKAIQEGEVGITGGAQWRPLVHVRDAAESIVLALQAPVSSVRGQIFNVGSNEQNYQIAEIGAMIRKMIPTARLVSQPGGDNRNYRVRFDKIHTTLNFEPRYTVPDGINEVIEAIRAGRIVDYRDCRYNNYAFLSQAERLPIRVGDETAL